MLAQPGSPSLVAGPGWAYEFKWDGIRAVVTADTRGHVVRTRRGNDVTAAYPELEGIGGAAGRAVVLDGEVVTFEPGTTRPSFARLQRRMHLRDPGRIALLRREVPVAYLVFDLLALDGEPVVERPYTDRRQRLEALGLAGPHWQVPPRGDDLGAMLTIAGDLGLEGVVAKRLDSRYRPGERSPDWRKIRLVARQELVVGGYLPGEGGRSGRLGSLVVGYHDEGGRLVDAGAVGSGLAEAEIDRLQALLDARRRDTSPFDAPGAVTRPGQVHVEPDLVVEVEFREWTPDGRLRQPSYKGLRDDKDAREVVRET